MLFYRDMGYTPDLEHPKTFNEKIQWLKLYYHRPECTMMVDKVAAKEYVAGIIGEEYIIPTLGVWERFEDIDFDKLDVKMLHLGYFLLLEKVDRGDGQAILKKAKDFGIQTSIDLVSENSERYSLVLPCLPYTDYLIINEVEAGKLTGIDPMDENLEMIARKLKELGVQEKVIIHKPDYAVSVL